MFGLVTIASANNDMSAGFPRCLDATSNTDAIDRERLLHFDNCGDIFFHGEQIELVLLQGDIAGFSKARSGQMHQQ